MSIDFAQILDHPLKEEILSKLVSGVSPKEINEWLRLKFSEKEQKHLIIAVKVLKEFAESEYKNYYTYLSKEIDKVQNPEDIKKIPTSLSKNKSFQERILQLVNDKIDINKRYLEIDLMCRDRIEQIFDVIQEDPSKIDGRKEYVLIKWIEQLQNCLDRYNKNVNQAPDQIIQHNYTIQYVDQQMAAVQAGLKEAMSKLDPEVSFLVMDCIAKHLSALKPDSVPAAVPVPSYKDNLEDITALAEKIESFQEKVSNSDEDNDE